MILLLGHLSAPSPVYAAFPGGAGKIVFVSNRDGDNEIFVMNADGTGQTQLTANTANDSGPRWSPDGTRIAFSSNRGGDPAVYVMNADGSGQTQLTFDVGGSQSPAWSPDGSQITFSSTRDDNLEIYVMNADGSEQVRLTNNNKADDEPVWSPDGTKIAFSSNRDGDRELFVMNPDGSGQTQLTFNSSIDDVQPDWSPDGARIAFARGPSFSAEREIWVMNADSSGETRLTDDPAIDNVPSFSPDATKLLFSSNRDGDAEIFVMNADGSGQTQLTSNTVDDVLPNWQPVGPGGLASWWRAEGNALDSVASNHGTLTNGTQFAAGKVGEAFSFDGGDDEIVVPHNANLNPGTGITIGAWVNQTSMGHGRTIAQMRTPGNDGGYTFETTHSPYAPDNGLQWAIWFQGDPPTTYTLVQTPANVLQPGIWQYIVATFDGKTARVFVDGVQRVAVCANASESPSTGCVTTRILDPSGEDFVIGRNLVDSSFAWHGMIDELQVYDRALSVGEINWLFHNPGAAVEADLQLTNSDSSDPIDVGTLLTYTLTVTNNGPSAASGVVVTDTLPANVDFDGATTSLGTCNQASGTVTCDIGTLASGAGAVITLTVVPTQPGPVSNSATVSATEPDPVASNNTGTQTTQVTGVAAADVSVLQTDSPDPITAGNALNYEIEVRSNGPSIATNVIVTDVLPANVTFVSASAIGGGAGAWTCSQASGIVTCSRASFVAMGFSRLSVTVIPTQAGTISNTVTVASTEPDPVPGNSTDTETTQVNPAPIHSADVWVTLSETQDPVKVGQTLRYEIRFGNFGPDAATNVRVVDTLPVPATDVLAISAGPGNIDCSRTTDGAGLAVVSCSIASLASGHAGRILIDVRPTQAGLISNTVTVAADEQDPYPATNSDTETTQVNALSADAWVTLSETHDPVKVGETLTYEIRFGNFGPDAATNVRVVDTLPVPAADVVGVSASPGNIHCSPTTIDAGLAVVSCSAASLASGHGGSILILLRPAQTGLISNTVTVTADEQDPYPATNSDTETTQVNTPIADVSVTATDSIDPAMVGQAFAFVIKLRNDGPDAATNVHVVDTLPVLAADVHVLAISGLPGTSCQPTTTTAGLGVESCTITSLASGQSGSIRIFVNPSQAGLLTNAVTVTSDTQDPNPANNSDTETTQVNPHIADLSVTAEDQTDPVMVGHNLVLSILVTNSGPDVATDVHVVDTLPFPAAEVGVLNIGGQLAGANCQLTANTAGLGVLSCSIASLPRGQGYVSILVRPAQPGLFTNSVTVTSATQDPNPANNSDTETTQVSPFTVVTVNTRPPGLTLRVDGDTLRAPRSFEWIIGSEHVIESLSPQQVSAGTRQVFTGWSDGGDISHTVTTPSSPVTYLAGFVTQHVLTTVAAQGNGVITATPPSADGYYEQGTSVQLRATPNQGFTFTNWTGHLTGTANPQSLVMNGPRSVTAHFQIVAVSITGAILNKSGPAAARLWTIALTNNGPGTAFDSLMTGFTLTHTLGPVCTPVVISPSAFPIALGTIRPRSSATTAVTIDFSSCSSLSRFTTEIAFSANSGLITGSIVLPNQSR